MTHVLTADDLRPVTGLLDSSPELDEKRTLDERFERDGYLFFRDVLPRPAIERARAAMARVLQEQGLLSDAGPNPTWIGDTTSPPGEESPLFEGIIRDLFADPGVIDVFERLIGGPFRTVPMVLYRAYPPNKPAGSVHQDAFFDGGQVTIAGYRPAWIPLMEMDEQVGGLALAPGQHLGGLLQRVTPANITPRLSPTDVPLGSWRRENYSPGDLLIISPFTPHCGLANRSSQVRLSVDTRLCDATATNIVLGELVKATPQSVTIDASGTTHRLTLTDRSYIRLTYGTPMTPEEFAANLVPGTQVFAVAEKDSGRVSLLRYAFCG
jgi:hypothetical protein